MSLSLIADDLLPPPQRRIRHIRALQVRNLTPFPARDALAQTLTQPGPSSSALHLQPADDIELTSASRRRRRISAGSMHTILNLELDDEVLTSSGTLNRRSARSSSRGSFQSAKNAISGQALTHSRPRVRTSSKASSPQLPTASVFSENADSGPPTEQTTSPTAGHFVTHSQRALEKIVSSRLVETFVTLTLQASTASRPPSQPNSPPSSPLATITSPRKGKETLVKRPVSASAVNHRKGASTSSTSSTLSVSSSHMSRSHSLASASSSPVSSRVRTTGSIRRQPSSRPATFPSPPPTPPPGSPRLKPHSATTSIRSSQGNSRQRENNLLCLVPTPFYMSPTHLPSTNPIFSQLDPEREFASWADSSATRFKVAIWGRSKAESLSSSRSESGKGLKGKAKEVVCSGDGHTDEESPWKILDEWLVDLDDMELLSPDFSAHHLPSNTLLLTLSSGQVFHIPPVSSLYPPSTQSRAPSPLGLESNSDGEVEGLRRRQWEREAKDAHWRERDALEKSLRETRMKKSSAWQDLVKMVNLKTCIVDTQESLVNLVRICDAMVEVDEYSKSSRECSEREEWVGTLRAERDQVIQESVKVKHSIEAQRKALELRRNTLAAARLIHQKDITELRSQAEEITYEKQGHSTLVSSMLPLRTSLIQTITFIFPIEPLSAADLLFTILGAPLPVPVMSSDPAPPLSLPSHPEITEDTTATALGYVAQVVQLVSAYLGRGLVYPVTCCGSRSVIKDPISAMMGPRMFPLYSRGVETYRFEYGVFLLNKNIEMLMMDRNLHVMDMRHTLPNLKNLLLTLTTGEEVKPRTRLKSPLGIALPSDMRPPTRNISPLALDAQSEEPSQTPPAPRKSTPFLSPLAAILRARYPSSAGRPTVKVVDEAPEPNADDDGEFESGAENGAETGIEPARTEGDGTVGETLFPQAEQVETKTIKPSNGMPHSPSSTNGIGRSVEKLTDITEPPTPPPPLPGVT